MKHPNHICRFNDAPQSCTCYDTGYEDALGEVRKSFDEWFKKGTEDVEDWADRLLGKEIEI